MRILVFNKDFPKIKSAYGKCLDEIWIKRIAKQTRHKIAAFTSVGIDNWEAEIDGVNCYPGLGQKIVGEDVILNHYADFKADLLWVQMDSWCFTKLYDYSAQRRLNLVMYIPIDFYPIPKYLIQRLSKAYGIVTMNQWAQDELRKAGLNNVLGYIYHGFNPSACKKYGKTKREVIEKFKGFRRALGANEKDFLITIVAANQPRKSWGQWFEGIKIFIDENPDINVKVYCHTIANISGGFNLGELVEFYGLKNVRIAQFYPYWLGRISEEQMAKMYAVSDVTLEANIEGFGMPVVESWANGTPSIGLNFGVQKELLEKVTPELLVDVGGWKMEANLLRKPIPNPISIAKKLKIAYENKDKYFERVSEFAQNNFSWDRIVKTGFIPLLDFIEKDFEKKCFKPPTQKNYPIKEVR